MHNLAAVFDPLGFVLGFREQRSQILTLPQCENTYSSQNRKEKDYILKLILEVVFLLVLFGLIILPSLRSSIRLEKSSQVRTVSSSNLFFKGSRFRYR